MVSIKDAVGDTVYITPKGYEHKNKLFQEDEIERAETITNALKGLSIESALISLNLSRNSLTDMFSTL